MPKAAAAKASTSKVAAKKPAAKKKVNGYQMPEKIPLGEVLTDLSKKQWRIGVTIGSGGFGDIYCASKAEANKKTDDYSYVVKVEPHGNGPLFVEMHFYMRNGKLADIETFRKKRNLKSLGMPHFVGHGSHELNKIKHRFVVMPRFGQDVWSLFLENNRKMPVHTIYRLAIQMLDVYEYIHECTYVHGDLKGANILLGYGKGGGSQAYLVDFGLASHYTTKDFKPDPKKMHNGTIEYTSRDAHQGVPTMRGDIEILAYNLIQWCGVQLPWEADKLLGTPVKVQAAKEDFMKNVDTSLKKCFGSTSCPEPIANFVKYVTKLSYDETPDYEKSRKDFKNGLKSLGKTNTADLEFKLSATATAKTTSPSVKENIKPTARRSIKSPVRSDLSDIAERSEDAIESPKKKATGGGRPRKRIQIDVDDSDEEAIPKKSRTKAAKTKTTKTTTQSGASGNTPTITVNNEVKGTKGKTYQLNFELDISFDANVVVNVKRKPKKTDDPKQQNGEASKKKMSIQSTDEIPATEPSRQASGRGIRKAPVTRTSPRSLK